MNEFKKLHRFFWRHSDSVWKEIEPLLIHQQNVVERVKSLVKE